MSDTIEQITCDLNDYLDDYCEHCVCNALVIQLATTIVRLSDTKQQAEENLGEITEMIRQIIAQSWDQLKAVDESQSAVRH